MKISDLASKLEHQNNSIPLEFLATGDATMTVLQKIVFGCIVINALVFIVATKAVFRADKAQAASYIFMASFGVILAISLWNLYQFPVFDTTRLGSAIGLTGLSSWLFFWATATIRRRPFTVIFSPDVPEFLNQDGPYKYVRHPFYTSYLINFFAAFLATNRLAIPGLTFLSILAIYIYAASLEERKFTSSPLQSQYIDYKKRTGMFLPRLFVR